MTLSWPSSVFLLYLGAILTVCGIFATVLGTIRANSESATEQARLADAGKRIEKLSNENRDIATGGTSFPVAVLSTPFNHPDHPGLLLIHRGDLTIPNITVKVKDMKAPLTREVEYSVPVLHKGEVIVLIDALTLVSSKYLYYRITTYTMNSEIVEELMGQNNNGIWVQSRVVRRAGQVIDHHDDPGFKKS